MIKKSKQRDYIFECISKRCDHPTADMIYMDVKEHFPNISLGTIYRNLSLLSDMGEILNLNIGDGKDHFDANTCSHQHFICNECGCIQDIFMEDLDFVNQLAEKNFDGTITGNCIYFHGLCNNCKKKK
ncbi:MAG: transcriptional repressor [Eubacterium sp.]